MLGEPDAVVATKEGVPLGVHRPGAHREDDDVWPTPARHARRGGLVRREVDVRARAPHEPCGADRIEEPGRRSVEERRGWGHRSEAEVDLDGVPLVGSYALPVLGDGEALLVTAADDLVELGVARRLSARGEPREHISRVGPPSLVQREAEGARLVAEREREELRDADGAAPVHERRVYARRVRTATVSEVTQAIDALARETPGGAIAFDGDGTFPFRHEVDGSDVSVTLTATRAYDVPGTYFATARVTSNREGKVDSQYRRLPNLDSARIVVT